MVALIDKGTSTQKIELSLQEIVENKIREKDEQPRRSKRKTKTEHRLVYLEERMKKYLASQLLHCRHNFTAPGYDIALKELAPLPGISFPVINQMELGNSSLDSITNLLSILACLSKAPSGIVPMMPKGSPPWTDVEFLEPSDVPLTPLNFMLLFTIRSGVEVDAIFYNCGVKSISPDWSDWEPVNVHKKRKTKKPVNNEYECTPTKERFIELVKLYALDRNLSFKSAIKQLSSDTNIPESTLNALCDPKDSFDTDELLMKQSVMLAGFLPHPEGLMWSHLKLIEHITMKKMIPFHELNITIHESTTKKLGEMTQ